MMTGKRDDKSWLFDNSVKFAFRFNSCVCRYDGGELRLFPYPLAHVDVAPRAGKLALFSSSGMVHRVMPARRGVQRCVLSLWFSGGEPESPSPTFPSRYPSWVLNGRGGSFSGEGGGSDDVTAAAAATAAATAAAADDDDDANAVVVSETLRIMSFLRRPVNARVLSKVMLAEEWAESISEAFGGDVALFTCTSQSLIYLSCCFFFSLATDE